MLVQGDNVVGVDWFRLLDSDDAPRPATLGRGNATEEKEEAHGSRFLAPRKAQGAWIAFDTRSTWIALAMRVCLQSTRCQRSAWFRYWRPRRSQANVFATGGQDGLKRMNGFAIGGQDGLKRMVLLLTNKTDKRMNALLETEPEQNARSTSNTNKTDKRMNALLETGGRLH